MTFDEKDIQSLIQYFEKNKIGYYLECNHVMYVNRLYHDWMQEAFKDFMPESAEEYTNSMIVVDGSQQIYEVNKISFLRTLNNFDQIYTDLHEHYDEYDVVMACPHLSYKIADYIEKYGNQVPIYVIPAMMNEQ